MSKKHILELSDKDVFILQCALERFMDIDDREYRRPAERAEKIEARLPRVNVTWDDVA